MNTIATYLDNVFAAFPQTEHIQTLKRDMLAGMEEKYVNLRQQGKSEYEAVGIVIANFGSIGEIAAELGIKAEEPTHVLTQVGTNADTPATRPEAADSEPTSNDFMQATFQEAWDYLRHQRKCGLWLGIGFWLVLSGMAVVNMVGGSTGGLIQVMALAIAIPIIIICFAKMYYYWESPSKNVKLDDEAHDDLERAHARFFPVYVIQAAIAIGVMVLAIVLALDARLVSNALLFPTLGFALFLYMPLCMVKLSYDYLLGIGSYVYKSGKLVVKNEKKLTMDVVILILYVCAAIWTFVTWTESRTMAAFSWVVWPVMFIFYGTTTDIISWFLPKRWNGVGGHSSRQKPR